MKLDQFDKNILDTLQQDARLSNVALARKVGLSESACLRRVKALEETGLIDRYVALVNQAKAGLPGNVFVRVSLENQTEENLERFAQKVQTVPEVMECYLMSGDVDFNLRVAVEDAADYERVHHRLTRLPGVNRVHSSFALRTIIKRTKLPDVGEV